MAGPGTKISRVHAECRFKEVRQDAYVALGGAHRWARDGHLFRELMEAAWHPARAAGLLACDS